MIFRLAWQWNFRWNFLIARYLVYLRLYPAAGHLDTAFIFRSILHVASLCCISWKIERAIIDKSMVVTAIVRTIRNALQQVNKHFSTVLSKLYKIEGDEVF